MDRIFHSYGPVNHKKHFCVPRTTLIDECLQHIIDDPDEGGHYFTIWAPRQTGKTWIMREVKNEIEGKYGNKFIVGTMSMQGVIFKEEDTADEFLKKVPRLIDKTFDITVKQPDDWEEISDLFLKKQENFKHPVILFIDEFDKLPIKVIDNLVSQFRDMYLDRDSYLLHGLALIGVRAVLGVESERGSPFNIQRSIHIPNFSKYEVSELFQQYIDESGQNIDLSVIDKVYEVTRGQPGLVCWFGELLTEKYNPGIDSTIDITIWNDAYYEALNTEWNNTILNLIKKAKKEYQEHVLSLFTKSELSFNLDKDWCNYLYMNGIIDNEVIVDEKDKKVKVCRFSSPFVQERIYNALTDELVGEHLPITPLNLSDTLEDVFKPDGLNIPALLQKYKDFLKRLKDKKINPWKKQPRRKDLHYREAVGHFHIYAWLQQAIGDKCVISPEFPTGNGKVDLRIMCKEHRATIEVKILSKAPEIKKFKAQAVDYARKLGEDSITIALFVSTEDEKIHEQFSIEETVDQVKVTFVPIAWSI